MNCARRNFHDDVSFLHQLRSVKFILSDSASKDEVPFVICRKIDDRGNIILPIPVGDLQFNNAP